MKRNILLLVFLAAGLVAQTAKFPGAIAGDADLLRAKDNAFSTLASPIDATTLSVPVTNGASFAGATYLSVTIENEQVLVCSVSGNTLTVCAGGRGFAGTTAATHAAFLAVRANNTAWHHNATAAEVKAIETALGADLANVLTAANLAAWTGSTNITTLGTIAAGTVPWARLSSVPTTFTPATHTHGGGDVTSAVATASALAADPADCAAGSAAGGINASGAATGCISVQKQLNFALFDPNVAIPVAVIPVWRAEYGAATLTRVSCMADTADAVIQIGTQYTTTALTANLTCSQNAWTGTTTSFANAAIGSGGGLELRTLSGTAKKIAVSITYTGN